LAAAGLSICRADTAWDFAVAPHTRYRLSFRTEPSGAGTAFWETRIFNRDGELPYEGLFAEPWQTIVPERSVYSHSFLTPRDGVRLTVSIKGSGKLPRLVDVALQPITNQNPVINGDFAGGLQDYSGWNGLRRAALGTNAVGKVVLRCEPSGYAMTDLIPVEPGATYRFAASSYPGRVLIYDCDRLRIDWVDDFDARKQPLLKMPEDAAYIRISYCDGRAAAGRVPVIDQVGIERVATGSAETEPPLSDFPGEIVLPPLAHPAEERAAREIQHWVRRIGGQRLRVLAQPSGRDRTRIFVGRSFAEQPYARDIAALEGADGYAVRRAGTDLYVFGARPGGTLFGAIRLIEKNSDLIFPRPLKACGAVFTPNPAFAFREADFLAKPGFPYRTMLGSYTVDSDAGIWQGRQGMNSSAGLYNQFERLEMGGCPSYEVNFMAAIAQSPNYTFEKCREAHPEFFALVNGKRLITQNGYTCYTAPGLAEALAEGLAEVVRQREARGETLENLGVRTRDGWTVCACEGCMEPIPLPDGTLLRPKADTSQADPLFFSTRMAVMLNRFAEAFAKRCPGRRVMVPAYIYASVPPAVPHHPLLIPSFCAYDTCSLRFPILEGTNNHIAAGGRQWEERFREFLIRNGTEDRRLSMFAYYYCNGFSSVADSAAADWSAMRRSGGIFNVHMDGFTPDTQNAFTLWDPMACERWIMTRLMWEPERDPQALREEYIRKCFGRAAAPMLAFHNIIRLAWKDPAILYGPNCHAGSAELFDMLIVKTGNEQKLRGLLSEAEKLANHPASRMLVQRMLAAFDHFAQSLNRIYVPLVPGAASEWNQPETTFWVQGLQLGGFKRISTWDDFKNAPASNQTQVAVMRDERNLYFRFLSLGAAEHDRVDLVLTSKRFGTPFLFALERNGSRHAMRSFVPWECPGWASAVFDGKGQYAGVFQVPLEVLGDLETTDGTIKLYVKCVRRVEKSGGIEESSLTGSALTRGHYMNYWTALSLELDP
jgi:hypothetical protein